MKRQSCVGFTLVVLLGASGCTDGRLTLWTGTQAADAGDVGAVPSSNVPSATVAPAPSQTLAPSVDAGASAPLLSPPLPVDDFEDGDTRAANDLGWWYSQSDTTGQDSFEVEASGDAARGGLSAHFSGSGFQVWGALFGLDFTPDEGFLDARNFHTLRFQARVSAGSLTRVSARLLDPAGQYGLELDLSTTWQEYELPFAGLVAVDGTGRQLDATRLSQLHIFIFSAEAFDLWLDDFVLE